MTFKKFLGVVGIALLIFAIITAPTATATAFSNLGSWLADVGNAIISFFTQLF